MKANTAFGAADAMDEKDEPASTVKPWKMYVQLSKTGIVVSNLLTAFAGFYLAAVYNGLSIAANMHILLITMAGTALVIAGGCTINNYIDRDIDPLMESKRHRPTVQGTIKPSNVLAAGVIESAVGTAILIYISPVAALIAVIGLVLYVFVYTMWLKRTHSLNTLLGSFAGAVPPLIGWAALDPGLHLYAWALFAIMFIWQPPHFLALAMMRADEYKNAGVPMLPVVAGFKMTKRQIVLYVMALLPVSLLLYSFGFIYTLAAILLGLGWLGLGIAGFRIKDEQRWAQMMFTYSLVYLSSLFAIIIIVHF